LNSELHTSTKIKTFDPLHHYVLQTRNLKAAMLYYAKRGFWVPDFRGRLQKSAKPLGRVDSTV